MTKRTLLIDADDTLWENNVYFERVVTEFIAQLVDRGISSDQARAVLGHTERRNIVLNGYGSRAFCQSLREAALELGVDGLNAWISQQECWLFSHPIELMAGVHVTLPLLRAKNQLIVLTKGDDREQRGKLERSGLSHCFDEVEVVAEKNMSAYRTTMQKHRLSCETTWMIGNSPRSDINPAKAAGLRTILIPYHATWQHEIEEISPHGETLVLESFAHLADHFG